MTVIFPEKLPYPTTEEYAIKPGEVIVRTDGPARQRRRYEQTPSKISVRWVMIENNSYFLRPGINTTQKKVLNGLLLLS